MPMPKSETLTRSRRRSVVALISTGRPSGE
jgi:hypothetical protein